MSYILNTYTVYILFIYVWQGFPHWWNPLGSSSYIYKLEPELRCCESRSSISRNLSSVCYFYRHVSERVREADEAPSHLSLLLWKPGIT